jgi:UDP-N-acetylmuramoyl-tripeptide--D-alanyl-D-alanine ligase
MDRPDPFFGYSFLVRTIVFVGIPAFTVFQFFRLRRALHVFQLEGYKRARFVDWCRSNRDRAWFLKSVPAKKPLVMTGRAKRILWTATILPTLLLLGACAAAHLAAGAPFDLVAWSLLTALIFVWTPHVLVAADVVLAPVQNAINGRFLRAASRKLEQVAPLVVGVTGSFGKTSTKFAIERLIGEPGEALATPGSFNTPLGVCRTINEQLAPHHRFFIVEMGAYGEGEIAELARFVKPRIGVLTAIGPAHLERFGSLDAIRRGKYEIVTNLPDDGIAVMNVDDPTVRELADLTTRVRVVRYGIEPAGRPDITATDVDVTPNGTTMTIRDTRNGSEVSASMRLLGKHAIGHVLAGVAVAIERGRTLTEVAGAIARLEPVEHRLQLIESPGGVTVIDDAYNSNPQGAAAALEVLAAMPGRRKVVVTPGIVELGPLQDSANEEFGRHAATVADEVIFVARLNRSALVRGAETDGSGATVTVVDSLEQATQRLAEILRPGDAVLFENDLPDQLEG